MIISFWSARTEAALLRCQYLLNYQIIIINYHDDESIIIIYSFIMLTIYQYYFIHYNQ